MNQKDYLEKIAFSLITKYSEPAEMVERCLSSIAPFVDGIFVTITKDNKDSDTSEIEKVLKKFNANVSYFDWVNDFAKARNFALSQISKEEYGWFFWMDADDVLQNGNKLQDVLHEAIINKYDEVFFSYWYSVDLNEKGQVKEIVIEHKRERLVKNDGSFKWIGRIHETLIEQRKTTKILKDDCIIVHLTKNERLMENLDRNIKILEDTVKEEKHKDPRTVMYLAKAYFDRAKNIGPEEDRKKDSDLAKVLFFEYLDGSGEPGTKGYQESSGWAEERATAWSYLSDLFRSEESFNRALKCSFNSVSEHPQWPSYYLDLALIYSIQGDWNKAEHWLKISLNVPIPQTTLIVNPRDLKTRALEIDYHIAISKNDIERAFESSKKLAEILPAMEPIQKRLVEIGKLREMNKASQSIVYLTKFLEVSGEPNKISSLLNAVPTSVEGEQFVSQMRNQYLPAKLWGKNEIAILCGGGFEKWSPKNVQTGIGGSEEAVIYLAKEFVKKGYKVTVYNDPREDRGEYEGVEYKPFYELNPKDNFNIMILWRAVQFADYNLTARQTYLWLHDVPANPEFTEERMKKIDKIFVLTEYHKSLLRMSRQGEMVAIPDEKVMVTRNGIPAVTINKKWARKPHQLIWGSSYDRGLPYLLNIWGDVKKAVPDAELHIYYGWDLYDYVHKGNPARMQWKAKVDEMMKQEGITHHGRVGHAELRKAYAESGIWAYPTDFTEISCISAMTAQSHGAFPVCTNMAALKETVKFGARVETDITDKDGQEEYKKVLIEFLQKDSDNEESRKEMMEESQKMFSWEGVATQWDELFKKGGVVNATV